MLSQVKLEQMLQESQYREQQLELVNSSLQHRLTHITEEKEEREKEAVSWFNSLEVNCSWLNGPQLTDDHWLLTDLFFIHSTC